MTRILLLCGSQRRGSINARLLAAVAHHIPAGIAVDRLERQDIDLPLFDQDREHDPEVLASLRALHARFAAADAVILASPEYNGLMTPYLKNVIDWVSRLPRIDPDAANAFLDQPVLLCSATPGWSGGGIAIPALRTLFGHVGAIPFGETICLPYADQAWDDDGQLVPALAALNWADCVRRFCALAGRTILGEAA